MGKGAPSGQPHQIMMKLCPKKCGWMACALFLVACGGESFEQSTANIDADYNAHIGPDGTVLFHLDEAGQTFDLTCEGASPFCGLSMEVGITAADDGLTDNQRELRRYGITLETYGPQSFDGGDEPSFTTEVPAADLVETSRSVGEIGVAHGGTLRFDLHDAWGLLTEGEFTGFDVELRFPLCEGGTAFCD